MRILLSSCVVGLVLVVGCGDDGGSGPTGAAGAAASGAAGNAAAGTGGAAGANATGGGAGTSSAAGHTSGGDCGIPANATSCLGAEAGLCNAYWGPGYSADLVKSICTAPQTVIAGACPVDGVYALCIVSDPSGNYTTQNILIEGGEPVQSAHAKQCEAAKGTVCVL